VNYIQTPFIIGNILKAKSLQAKGNWHQHVVYNTKQSKQCLEPLKSVLFNWWYMEDHRVMHKVICKLSFYTYLNLKTINFINKIVLIYIYIYFVVYIYIYISPFLKCVLKYYPIIQI